MHLYKTSKGNILQQDTQFFLLEDDWDTLINREALHSHLLQLTATTEMLAGEHEEYLMNNYLLPPIGSQEVWAAGVTYLRSRDARMEESEAAGGADCYERVYEAERPELFFKSLSHRVAGHKENVHIRKDSTLNVPEPELAIYINAQGNIQAYTIGNDMSSRSIEGENPLYLPQAKIYERSAAIGPCLFVPDGPIAPETAIHIDIYRHGEKMFEDATTLISMKRTLNELAAWLYREMDFAQGCFLMTGTSIVPPPEFSLKENDIVNISIEGIGMLSNIIVEKK